MSATLKETFTAKYNGVLPRTPQARHGRCYKIIFAVGWVRTVVAIAVLERFEQKPLYGLSTMAKTVAVVERMTLVEIRLHISQLNTG